MTKINNFLIALMIILSQIFYCKPSNKSLKVIDINLPTIKILASSTLREGIEPNKYSLINIFDDDDATTWAEGWDSDGVNEFIYIDFFDPQEEDGLQEVYHNIDKILIKNGYTQNENLYYSNNRIRTITLQIKTKGMSSDCLESKFVLSDNKLGYQEIIIPNNLSENIEKIKITITGIFKGKKYDDTCISDIKLITMGKALKFKEILTMPDIHSFYANGTFDFSINHTGANYVDFISPSNNTNGLIIMDAKYFYIFDIKNNKVEISENVYKHRYEYKLDNNILYSNIHDKWQKVDYTTHNYEGNTYTNNGKICFDFNHEIKFRFENINQVYRPTEDGDIRHIDTTELSDFRYKLQPIRFSDKLNKTDK